MTGRAKVSLQGWRTHTALARAGTRRSQRWTYATIPRCEFHGTRSAPLLDFLFGKKPASPTQPTTSPDQRESALRSVLNRWNKVKPLLTPDNLFHPLAESPIPSIREKHDFVAKHGCCPVCVDHQPFTPRLIDHMQSGLKHAQPTAATSAATDPNWLVKAKPEQQVLTLNQIQSKPPAFVCPDCGYPTHCSEDHYLQDKLSHEQLCRWLRETNMDEHDLRSGRQFREFEFPAYQGNDEAVNLSSWDTFLYTRNFPNLVNTRAIHHVTKLLTYPLTIASVIHPLSPYNLRNRLTPEGLRSLAALRTTLGEHTTAKNRKDVIFDPLRIFIVGARAEAMLPPHVHLQLSYMFPHSPLHIYFIGPEAMPPSNSVQHQLGVSAQMMLRWDRKLFHEFYHEVTPFDPYRDIFFLFGPGLGYPFTRPFWQPSMKIMIETQCPIFVTAYNEGDLAADLKAVEADYGADIDWLLQPGENIFKSEKKEVNLLDLTDRSKVNWHLYGIRGKKYEVAFNDDDEA